MPDEHRFAPRARLKVPQRTVERVGRLRRLVARLHEGELSRDEAARMLGMMDGAVRSYLNELVAGRIVAVREQENAAGRSFYRLNATQERIDEFLEMATQASRRIEAKPSVSQMVKIAQSGRHVHLMQDDQPFLPKLPSQTVRPDPLALPVDFFRSRPA
jgi:predicted ArsR family transcriptional regulator